MMGQNEGVIQVMSTTQGGRERNQAWEKDVILHNGGVGQDQLFLKKKMVKQEKEQKVDEEQKHEIASGTNHNIWVFNGVNKGSTVNCSSFLSWTGSTVC